MADGSIIIDTKMDSKEVIKELDKLGIKLKEVGDKGEKSTFSLENMGKKLNSMANTGLKALTGMVTGAVVGVGALAKVGVDYNSTMEQYQASFETLLGSTDKATEHVKALREMGAKTPFEMGDLAEASKTLLAFGIDANDSMTVMKQLGDISLGNKEKFNGLALVMGQVSSAGKMTGQDLMQFINQGFNPLNEIAKKTGESMSDLKDRMSEGKVTYEEVADAIASATEEGGQFYQGMEKQSKTLSGQLSTLKDNVNSLIGDAFNPLFSAIKNNLLPKVFELVSALTEKFKSEEIQAKIKAISDKFVELATNGLNTVIEHLPDILDFFSWVMDNGDTIIKVILGIIGALKGISIITNIIGFINAIKSLGIISSIASVGSSLLALINPVGLIIATVGALIGTLVYLWNTNENFRNAVIEIWNNIKEFFCMIGDYIVEIWQNAWDYTKAKWDAIKTFFTEILPEIYNNIKEYFSNMRKEVYDKCVECVENVKEKFTNIKDSIIEKCTQIVQNVKDWFTNMKDSIKEKLDNIITNVKTWGDNIWSKMCEIARNMVNGFINFVSELPSKMWTFLNNVISTVLSWGQDLGNKGWECAKSLVRNVIDGVSELPSEMVSIGKNLVQGLWNGVSNAKDWIIGKIGGFTESVKDSICDFFGINSPSRLMRDLVGKNLVKGIGVGVELETPNLEKDIDSNMNDIVATMQGTVFEESGTFKTTGLYRNGQTITNNDNGITQNVTIVNPERTPSENARLLKQVARGLMHG